MGQYLKGNIMAPIKSIMADRYNAHVQVSNACNSCLSCKCVRYSTYARLFTHMCVLLILNHKLITD